jgi:hypothetical protein
MSYLFKILKNSYSKNLIKIASELSHQNFEEIISDIKLEKYLIFTNRF